MTRPFHAVVLSAPNSVQPLVAGLTAADRTRRALGQLHHHQPRPSDPYPVMLLIAADALVEPAAMEALIAGADQGTATLAASDDPARSAALALTRSIVPPTSAAYVDVADVTLRRRHIEVG